MTLEIVTVENNRGGRNMKKVHTLSIHNFLPTQISHTAFFHKVNSHQRLFSIVI